MSAIQCTKCGRWGETDREKRFSEPFSRRTDRRDIYVEETLDLGFKGLIDIKKRKTQTI